MGNSVLFVIDDEVTLRELIGELLQDEGYEVYGFSDGLPALVAARDRMEKKLGLDLILTDVNMPNMSGVKLTQELRAAGFSKPIVLFSGESAEELDALKKIPGVSGVETKPYNSKALLERIANLLK